VSDNKYVSIDERWEYLVTSMILGDSFIHQFVIMMVKEADERIGTMGVRIKNAMIELVYSPKFMETLTDSEVRWVLVHEILHIVFHHCTVRGSTDPRMQHLDNIAADLAINQLIPNTGFVLQPREEVIKICLPKAFNFPEKLSKEQYFQLLLKEEQENKDKNKGKDKGKGKDKDQGGSGSGDDPDDQDDQGESGPGSGKGDDPFKGKGEVIDNHDGWTEEEAEIIDEIIRNKVDQMSRSSKSWGNISGGIKEMIMAAQRPQLAWWRILREYLGLFSTTKKESTMKRPNRRYGYPFPGVKRRHVDKILCCVDTSGSISEDSLRKFLSEMNVMTETHPVDLVVFDVKIQQGPIPFTKKRKNFAFGGRGGTCFNEIMEFASKGKYKCMVILTDGAASAPEYPKGVRDIIWCLVDDGKPPVEWGRRVNIKDKPDAQRAR
jgi:predicted metal-dependent peptidase